MEAVWGFDSPAMPLGFNPEALNQQTPQFALEGRVINTTVITQSAAAAAAKEELAALLASDTTLAAVIDAVATANVAKTAEEGAVAVHAAVRGEFYKSVFTAVAAGASLASVGRALTLQKKSGEEVPSYIKGSQAAVKAALLVGRVLSEFAEPHDLGVSTITLPNALEARADGQPRSIGHLSTVLSQQWQPTATQAKEFGLRTAEEVIDLCKSDPSFKDVKSVVFLLEQEVAAYLKAQADAADKAAAEAKAAAKAAKEDEEGAEGAWKKGLRGLPKNSLFTSLLNALSEGAVPSAEDLALLDEVLSNVKHLADTAKAAATAAAAV